MRGTDVRNRMTIALLALVFVLGTAVAALAKPGDPAPRWDDVQEKFVEVPPGPEGMALLYKMLKARDAGVRERAAWALGDAGVPASFKQLVDTIEADTDAFVRAESARSLGRLKARDAVWTLIAKLSDGDGAVRMDAAWALGEIGDQRAVPKLGYLATSDPDFQVACEAATALGKIGNTAAAKYVLEALERKSPVLRLASLRALGGFKKDKAQVMGALKTNLKSASIAERAASAVSLTSIDAKEAAPEIAALIEDPHPTVRREAVRALGLLTGDKYKTLIVGRTHDKDPMVRREAAVQIGEQKILSADVDLFRLFADPHLYVRDASLKSFVSFKNASIVRLAGQGLVHKNAYTREYSSHALGLLKTNAHIQAQIKLLKDKVGPVRRITAWALGEIGDPVACPALLDCAKLYVQDWEASVNAIVSMGQMKYQPCAPWLRTVIPQKFKINYEVRKAGTWTVGELKDKDSIGILISRLSDINPMTGEGLSLRFEAAIALGKIGETRAVGSLTTFMKREEEPNSMKKACKWALENILKREVDFEIKEYPPSEKFYFINPIKKPKPKETEE